VAIDMCAAYRCASTSPTRPLVVDHFHVVQLANQTLSQVRRRATSTLRGRRVRKDDPEYGIRRRLLRNREDLTDAKLADMWNRLIDLGEPGEQILTAWIAKENLRELLALARTHVVLQPATGGDGGTLAALLLVWGVAATAGNLGAGRLSDRFGGHRVALVALVVAAADFALLRWTAATLPGAVVVLVVWGLAGWGLLVAQQHRLVTFAPAAAPLLIGLNSSATYLAVSASGVIGAGAIAWVGGQWLGAVGAVFIVAALAVAALAPRAARPDPADADLSAAPRR
jgi:hypothetical protein